MFHKTFYIVIEGFRARGLFFFSIDTVIQKLELFAIYESFEFFSILMSDATQQMILEDLCPLITFFV